MPDGRMQTADGRRPTVVVVDHCAQFSGAELALCRLVPELAREVDVVVVLGEVGPLMSRLEGTGVRVIVLPMLANLRDRRKESAARAEDVLRTAAYAWRLRGVLRELEADLVHTNSLKAAVYGGLAGRLARIPVVWHVRDRIAEDYLPKTAVRVVRALANVLPSAIIVNSQATLATLPRSSMATVVHNAVVADAVVAGRSVAPKAKHGPLVFGVVGRLATWKGQHVFLEAFARAFRGTGHTARVIGAAMFGERDYEQQLRRQILTLGLARQVEMVGFREDVDAEYRALDVLVHCSVVPEPFGQVVIEGMAAGLGVIAAGAGGPVEIIEPEVDGLLVPPGDADALACAMSRLDSDRQLLCRLGAHAAVTAERFSPEATARGVLSVYRALLPQERLP